MARMKVWQLNEDARDVVLNVTLESDDGRQRFGSRQITLPKTATETDIRTAILNARTDIRDAPVGNVEDIARVIVDRINSGDIP